MDQVKVVVRKLPDSGGRVRTGILLAKQGSAMTVRWDDDGTEEEVVFSATTRFAPQGSLLHQALVDIAAFTARLEADPVTVVASLLSEHKSALTTTEIKQKFMDLGVAREVVDRVWKQAQKKLVEHDGIRSTGRMTYKWTRAKAETPTQAEGPGDSDTEVASEPAPVKDLSARPVPGAAPAEVVDVAGEAVGVAGAPDGTAEPVDASGESAEAQTTPGAVSLAEAFAAALTDEPVPTALHYGQQPLATAARLGSRLDDAGVDRLLTSVCDEERAQAHALLLALPRPAEPIDAAQQQSAVDLTSIQAVLAAAAAELRGRSPSGPGLKSAASGLLRRVVDWPLEAQALPALIELTATATATATEPGKDELEILESVTQILHRRLPVMKPDERKAVAPELVARIAAKLPLTRRGGRAALLSAVSGVWPERIADEIWWREVSLTELTDCASGVLGRVTARQEVAERVIAPLMARELSKVTSRTRLSGLLALPQEFVEYLPAQGIANAFQRVAGNDPVVDSWVRALAREGRMARLEADVEQAQAERRQADERAERAEARSRELTARSERLENLLQQQHERSVGVRASQERQLQIDVLRSMADLAAEVEELTASKVTPEVLIERVHAMLSDQGLEVVGEVGAEAPFDPGSHEPLIGAPTAGEPITVLRPGCLWRSGSEDVLLSRALVSPPQ
ncbi:hypothetical protein ACRYCC_27235 [Actinomadura scrupuli]|uniref:hypothetical protein n=1 Tax=Actinomadura scrupuli TaxID=559629 RepID=UPI003D9710A7